MLQECNFTLTTDKPTYLSGQPVHITGLVTTLTGAPVASQPLTIMVSKDNGDDVLSEYFDTSTRKFATSTDSAGRISFIFTPAAGDAGDFSASAVLTASVYCTSGNCGFSILAASISPAQLQVTTTKNHTYSKTFTLQNLSSEPLTGGQITLLDNQPNDNVTAALLCSLPQSLAAGSAVPVTLNVTIPEDAPAAASFTLVFTSNEGVRQTATVTKRRGPI